LVPQHQARCKTSTPQPKVLPSETAAHEPAGGAGAQAPALSHSPSAAAVIVQAVPAALLVGAEQTPAPEQVPGSVHCVEGQVVRSHAATQAPPTLHFPLPAAVKSQAGVPALGVSQAPVVRPQVRHWFAPVHVTPVQRAEQTPAPSQLPGELPR
jgi:hypothetical protein